MLAAGIAVGLRQLVCLRAVDPPLVGEEQQPVVGGRDEKPLDDVILLQAGTLHPPAAAALRAVEIGLGALGVAAARHRDDDILLGDEVLGAHVALEGHDAGTPLVAVALDDLAELLADDPPLPGRVGQNRLQVSDLALLLVELVEDALALQGGKPAQLHVEDRNGLQLVDVEQRHQIAARGLRAGAVANQRDDVVKAVQRLAERAQDVCPLLGPAQLEAGAAHDHVDLVRDVVADELLEPQRARHPVDDREHVAAEGVLQLGVLVEVVQHDLGDRVALEHDDQPLPEPLAALVADIGDATDLAVPHKVGDRLGEVVGVDLVGQLGDDQDRAALGVLVDLDHRAHPDRPAPRTVSLGDPVPAHDERAGREVRALDALEQRLHQLLGTCLGMRQEPLHTEPDLAQVVRRDIRRHPHRDAGRAVHQQVRDPARQDRRLQRAPVVVRGEVDRLLVDLAQHLHRQRCQPALGVVGDEAVGQERVVLAVDPEGEDRLHAGVLDAGHLGVVVQPGHQRLDDRERLRVGDVAADLVAVAFPALDPVDVVRGEPAAVGRVGRARLTQVGRDVRDMVAGQGGARDVVGQDRQQLELLAPPEADPLHEQAGVTALADVDLPLARRVQAAAADHAELEQQLLHIDAELLADCGVADLHAVAREPAAGAVAFEQGLEKGLLVGRPLLPHR